MDTNNIDKLLRVKAARRVDQEIETAFKVVLSLHIAHISHTLTKDERLAIATLISNDIHFNWYDILDLFKTQLRSRMVPKIHEQLAKELLETVEKLEDLTAEVENIPRA